MKKYYCKCRYCGTVWVDTEIHSWKEHSRKCPHCAESKNLDVKLLTEDKMDIFGYRFSPPFARSYENYYF